MPCGISLIDSGSMHHSTPQRVSEYDSEVATPPVTRCGFLPAKSPLVAVPRSSATGVLSVTCPRHESTSVSRWADGYLECEFCALAGRVAMIGKAAAARSLA